MNNIQNGFAVNTRYFTIKRNAKRHCYSKHLGELYCIIPFREYLRNLQYLGSMQNSNGSLSSQVPIQNDDTTDNIDKQYESREIVI